MHAADRGAATARKSGNRFEPKGRRERGKDRSFEQMVHWSGRKAFRFEQMVRLLERKAFRFEQMVQLLERKALRFE